MQIKYIDTSSVEESELFLKAWISWMTQIVSSDQESNIFFLTQIASSDRESVKYDIRMRLCMLIWSRYVSKHIYMSSNMFTWIFHVTSSATLAGFGASHNRRLLKVFSYISLYLSLRKPIWRFPSPSGVVGLGLLAFIQPSRNKQNLSITELFKS